MWLGEMLDKINISVYSVDKQKYESISNVKGSYEKVINSIKELRFRYPTLKICINTVLMKNINDSIEDIEALIKFSSSIKADLKFIEVYPDTIKEFINIEKIVQKIEKIGYTNKNNIFRKQVYSKENHNIYIQKCSCSVVSEMKNKEKVCKENNDLFISQDGAVNLCRKSEDVIDLYSIIKNRQDNELIKSIENIYKNMGKNCKC